MTEASDEVLVEQRERILLITINRPNARNAVNAEPGQALDAALELAARITANGPLAVAATKKIIVESGGWSDEDQWRKQFEILMPVFASKDAREGAVAFAEKRTPQWTGT